MKCLYENTRISRPVNIFAIQEKKDDTQDGISPDQPLLEQTLLMMESTPSQDNRDIILDVTLLAENLVAVSNGKAKVFAFSLFISMVA